MNKFKMELTWYNCQTCPPEENENDNIIIADYSGSREGAWYGSDGYFLFYKDCGYLPLIGDYKNFWWTDLNQTIRETKEFKEEI